jgi:uncharacterized protein YjbI with pentapeptide repeats
MPDHDPTVLPVKRMNYYQYQFLNVGDFTAEQDYHRAMRYRHNRALHSRGVAEGLDVTPKSNQLAVTVSPGLAIDGEGREMVVLPPGRDVTLAGLPGDVNVLIEYQAVEDDPAASTGTPGNTRMNEDPHVFATPQQPTGDQILLAKVSISAGVVTNVDASVRQYSSAVARADQVLSAQIKEADGGSAQNTEIGSGIKTGHIQDGAVTMLKLADDAVTSGKIAPADGSSGQDVNSGAGVKTGHIQDAAVTGAKIQDGSVPGAKLTDLSVSGAKLVDNTVPGPKLVDNSLSGAKLADNTVQGAKLADNTVQGAKLADNSVAGAKLQNLTVTGAKVADNSVPGGKLQDLTVAGGKLTDNSVPGAKLVDLTVPGTKLADNSVHGAKLLDSSVGGGKLIDGAIPGTKLTDNTLPGGKLTDNSMPGTKLTDNSVAGTKLNDRSIPQTKHALSSISFAELKALTWGPWKNTFALTPAVISAMTSATGFQFTNFSLWMPQAAGYPEPATQTSMSAWADHLLYLWNIAAITPDANVTLNGLRFEFSTMKTYYYPPSSGNNAQMNRNVAITAYAFGVTVPAGTTPSIAVFISMTALQSA